MEVKTSERLFTIEEYLEKEDRAMHKHEFHNGTIIKTAGAFSPHNLVKAEILVLLNLVFKTQKLPYWVFDSDMKVRLEKHNKFYYPDVSVSDGIPFYYFMPNGKERRDIYINPIAIVEVLSKSTRSKDKTTKFEEYKCIPTFKEYLLVEPEKVWVEARHRVNGHWVSDILTDLDDRVHLPHLGFSLLLRDIYRPAIALDFLKI